MSHRTAVGGYDDHITTRLLVVAEMLEKAVQEVHRAMAEIRGEMSSEPPSRTDDLQENPDDEH